MKGFATHTVAFVFFLIVLKAMLHQRKEIQKKGRNKRVQLRENKE
jgi:hypothetical protein